MAFYFLSLNQNFGVVFLISLHKKNNLPIDKKYPLKNSKTALRFKYRNEKEVNTNNVAQRKREHHTTG